jgi:cell division septal protein FtsQ
VTQPVLSLPRRRPPVLLRVLPSGRALLIATAVVLIAGGLYGVARETSMFAVRTVVIQGATPALAAQVRAALRQVEGTNLLALKGRDVVPRVENLPAVQSATYDRDFPHTLRVRIVPEVPVAVLRSGAASWLISARARVISVVDSGTFRAVPRIWLPTGFDVPTGVFLTGDAAAAARALRAFLQARFADGVAWARIRQGELTLGTHSGLELRLGAPVDLPLKIAIVKSISPTLTRPSVGGPTYLDVSVPERPVAGTNSQVAG